MSLPQSPYFTLEQLAEGVYAAIGKPGSPAYSNAGIIDTGEQTLIFDTFNTPLAAEDLQFAAETLTGRPARFVVNSHAHSDHWMGNQVFSAAAILSSQQNLAFMGAAADELRDLKRNPDEYLIYLRDLENRLAASSEPQLRTHLKWTLAIERHQFEHLREFKPCLPNQTFTGRLSLHGSRHKLEIYSPGAGHTASDVILVLPEQGIAFIGDLGFFQTHPFLGDCQPQDWIATLDQLAAQELQTYVPGHGPTGGKADLLVLKEYLQTLEALVETALAAGNNEDEAAAQPMPAFAAEWAGFGRFQSSLHFIYQQKQK